MIFYVIVNQGLYNKMTSTKMKGNKGYKHDYETKDVVIEVVGQLTNNKWVFQACYSDEHYLENKCATFEIDDFQLQDWKDEYGENNVVTSLDGLEFK